MCYLHPSPCLGRRGNPGGPFLELGATTAGRYHANLPRPSSVRPRGQRSGNQQRLAVALRSSNSEPGAGKGLMNPTMPHSQPGRRARRVDEWTVPVRQGGWLSAAAELTTQSLPGAVAGLMLTRTTFAFRLTRRWCQRRLLWARPTQYGDVSRMRPSLREEIADYRSDVRSSSRLARGASPAPHMEPQNLHGRRISRPDKSPWCDHLLSCWEDEPHPQGEDKPFSTVPSMPLAHRPLYQENRLLRSAKHLRPRSRASSYWRDERSVGIARVHDSALYGRAGRYLFKCPTGAWQR